MSETKREIKISEVLDLLNQGNDRAAIREHYGLTHQEMSALFQHPKLKNRKPKSQPSFVLVDDTEENEEVNGSDENTTTENTTENGVSEIANEIGDNEPVAEVTEEIVNEAPVWK